LFGHSIVSQHFIEPEGSRALHLFLSRARPIQSTSPHPTSTRSIVILSNHLGLGLPSHMAMSTHHEALSAIHSYFLLFKARGVFRLRNVNIVGFFFYLFNCYMFRQYDNGSVVSRVSSRKICLLEDGRMTETCNNYINRKKNLQY
jgi:hypothetical protein